MDRERARGLYILRGILSELMGDFSLTKGITRTARKEKMETLFAACL